MCSILFGKFSRLVPNVHCPEVGGGGVEGVRGELSQDCINPFTPKSDQLQTSHCSLTRNITSHNMENLAFLSSLRGQMIVLPILTTSCGSEGLRDRWDWQAHCNI